MGPKIGYILSVQDLRRQKSETKFSNALWQRDHFVLHVPTSKLPFEALNTTFFDRLDTFSDAIDLKSTLVLSVLRLG